MSIKSTNYVTRETAMHTIMMKLPHLTNEQLADVLEECVHNGFYNFRIVSQEEFDRNKEEEYRSPYIEFYHQMPEPNDAH